MKTVTITVTQKDIDRAHKTVNVDGSVIRACGCPIALASKRVFHNTVTVSVNGGVHVYKQPKGKPRRCTKYALSQEAKDFVYKFDKANKTRVPTCSPGSFTITLTKEKV